jgi:hypothetical protein
MELSQCEAGLGLSRKSLGDTTEVFYPLLDLLGLVMVIAANNGRK